MYGPQDVHETIEELLQGPPEQRSNIPATPPMPGRKIIHNARQLDDAVEVIYPADAQSRRRLNSETGGQISPGEI